jgi:hypothetical protein
MGKNAIYEACKVCGQFNCDHDRKESKQMTMDYKMSDVADLVRVEVMRALRDYMPTVAHSNKTARPESKCEITKSDLYEKGKEIGYLTQPELELILIERLQKATKDFEKWSLLITIQNSVILPRAL